MSPFSPEKDAEFMRAAIELAEEAGRCGEVPVGAVIVGPDGQLVGRGFNQPIRRAASRVLSSGTPEAAAKAA